MSLSFLTLDNRFIFVNRSTRQIANPSCLVADVAYDVYVVVENADSKTALEAKATVTHSGFDRAAPCYGAGIEQPPSITVPAAAFGIPGQATLSFTYSPSGTGRGSLAVWIKPNGPAVRQDVVVQNGNSLSQLRIVTGWPQAIQL